MKIRACVFIIFVISIFNLDYVYAVGIRAYSVFYECGAKENPEFVYDEIIFITEFSPEATAFILFTKMFDNKPLEAVSFVPSDTKFLFARFSEGNLAINVSKEIKNYGGSYYERHLINQIAETAFSLYYVQTLSIYIEGELGELPEGSVIKNYTREQHEEIILYQFRSQNHKASSETPMYCCRF